MRLMFHLDFDLLRLYYARSLLAKLGSKMNDVW